MRRSLVPRRVVAADSFLLPPARLPISTVALRRSSTLCACCLRGLKKELRFCGCRHTSKLTQRGPLGLAAPGRGGLPRSGTGLLQQVRGTSAGITNGIENRAPDPNYGPMQAYDSRVGNGRLRDDGHQRGMRISEKYCVLLC
jgi:hypothetical protein